LTPKIDDSSSFRSSTPEYIFGTTTVIKTTELTIEDLAVMIGKEGLQPQQPKEISLDHDLSEKKVGIGKG